MEEGERKVGRRGSGLVQAREKGEKRERLSYIPRHEK